MRALGRLKLEDDFVRVDDIEVAPQQLPNKIGIGVIEIQQRNTVLELVTLGGEMGDPALPLIQQSDIFAPRQQPARAGKRQAAEQQQHPESAQLGQLFARDAAFDDGFVHGAHRITVKMRIQAIFAGF